MRVTCHDHFVILNRSHNISSEMLVDEAPDTQLSVAPYTFNAFDERRSFMSMHNDRVMNVHVFILYMFRSNLYQTEWIQDACNTCDKYACYVRREPYVEGTHGGVNMSTFLYMHWFRRCYVLGITFRL